ncbi:MAG: hypothetical protein H6Q45_625 [Deltaproteobacteria bacterium]|nr:hypothetical protein [Deltaproteobacteria bacterium]
MRVRIAICSALVFLALGCAHRVEMIDLPPGTGDFLPSEVGIRVPAILEKIDLRINGNNIEPPEEFRRLIVQKLQRTYVFQEVATLADSGMMKDREKAVNLEVSINGALETRELGNLFRSAFFFLSSELPNKDQFDITILLKAVRSDKAERRYRSRIQGVAYYRFFAGEQAKWEAQDQVLTRGLNDLMRQLMRDVDFFAGKMR